MNEQLAGRCDGRIQIQPFDFKRESDRFELREVVKHLLDSLPFAGGLNLLDEHLFVRLFLLTQGHVGIVRNFIRQAFILSSEKGNSGLTWENLVAAADSLVEGSSEIVANPFRFDDGRLRREVETSLV